MNDFADAEKTNPIKPNQTRSEAEIPTGELLGILKPGTNLKILYKDYVQNWCYLLD